MDESLNRSIASISGNTVIVPYRTTRERELDRFFVLNLCEFCNGSADVDGCIEVCVTLRRAAQYAQALICVLPSYIHCDLIREREYSVIDVQWMKSMRH